MDVKKRLLSNKKDLGQRLQGAHGTIVNVTISLRQLQAEILENLRLEDSERSKDEFSAEDACEIETISAHLSIASELVRQSYHIKDYDAGN